MADRFDLDLYNSTDDARIRRMLTNNMSGIEGIPYQFMDTVDRRLKNTNIGRKYAEKIMARLPLLFLTPCKPVFMSDFNSADKATVTEMLLSNVKDRDGLINGSGKFYSVDFDYANYYNFLRCMLSSVAAFLGIYNKRIKLGGKESSVGTFPWNNELNDDFKSFFSASENLIFYLDGMSSVSEQFSNDTTEPSLASQINGFSDMANEINFLFGEKEGNVASSFMGAADDVSSSILGSLSGVLNKLGGGIVGSLAESGVSTVLNGGKIMFPEIWSNSSYSRSYNIELKLRSPDNDSLSIFLNVLKPYCKILALTLPRLMEKDGGQINPNGYRAPFLVKGFCKGLFNVDMGIISSLSVTKGAECCWNDDGLPTQIDISIELKDLYNNMAMSGFGDPMKSIVNNTAYMDFLANMAGLNIATTEIGRKAKMYFYLTKTNIAQTPARAFTAIDQAISRFMGQLYDFTS